MQASSDQPTTPRSLRFDAPSLRRPSDADDTAPKSPRSPLRSLKERAPLPHLRKRSNTTEETRFLHPQSTGLQHAATSPDLGRVDEGSSQNGLFKTWSNDNDDDPWETPLESPPIDASPLPTTPRLRASTLLPDPRKLMYAHPESGKFKPRPAPQMNTRETFASDAPPFPVRMEPPTLPPPTESFNFALRDSVKSSTTYVSSVNEISATSRSSATTSLTSASDLVSPRFPFSRPSLEDEISVDDYIALYAQGFEDDPPAPAELTVPVVPNKPAVSSPLKPSREQKPLPPRIEIPPISKKSFPEISQSSRGDIRKPEVRIGSSGENQPLPVPSKPITAATSSTSTNLSLPPDPSQAAGGRVTSAQLLAGELPIEPNLGFLEPPPDPNADRYGFKKDSQYITLAQFEEWNAGYCKYLARRRQKWDELMRQYSLNSGNPTEFPPRSDKTKRYVRKGIPPDWRGAAWFWYAGGPARLNQNPGLYTRLLERCEQYTQLGESDREHIERDLYRTFPDNDKFRRRPDDPNATHRGSMASSAAMSVESRVSSAMNQAYDRPMISALRRVLRAFAVHQPRIGYCQSLNFLAGQLLLFLDGQEEKAFHLLCILTSEHLPGTHGIALEGANVDIGVLMGTLKDREPQLWAKLDDRVVDNTGASPMSPSKSRQLPTVSLATTSWFMSCFVGSLPVEACCRVWDVLFYEGPKTLFRIALGIFRTGAEEIKRIRDPMEVFQVVQTLPRKMIDANALMEASFGKTLEGRGLLSQGTVSKRREERREIYANDRKERQGSVRQRAGNAATDMTADSAHTNDSSRGRNNEPENEKRRPSLSRGTSLRRLGRWRSGKGKEQVGEPPPMPGLPR